MGRSKIALVALLCASCTAPAPVVQTTACPPPKEYTAAQERQAKAEYDALPLGSMLRVLTDDYGKERAALRACRGG